MATYGELITAPGLLAGASLANYQYCPVKLASTAGEVVRATAYTDKVIGVLQNDPADGEPAIVAVAGKTKLVLAASQTAGTFVSPNSTSYAQASTTAGATCFAMLLEDGTSAGEIHEAIIVNFRY